MATLNITPTIANDLGNALEAPPSSLVVDTLIDEADGSVTDGDVSLRDALALIADGGTITFAESLVTGDNNGTISLRDSELVIDKSVTIDGDLNHDGIADITVRRGGGDASRFRIFNIDDGDSTRDRTVALNGLTITGGSSSGSGGGIRSSEALTLTHSIVRNNSARDGGGIFGGDNLTVNHSTVRNNTARNGSGGGIFGGDNLTVNHSTVRNNTVLGESIFDGNFSPDSNLGGGIFSSGDNLIVRNSIISGNSVSSRFSGGYGGGISSRGDNLIVSNSSISNNSVTSNRARGGGIFNRNGSNLTVSNSTISGNSLYFPSGSFDYSRSLYYGDVPNIPYSVLYIVKDFPHGSGIFNAGNLIVSNSTVSSNSGQTEYTGPSTTSGIYSGEFYVFSFENPISLTVSSSTISGNEGDGVRVNIGTSTISNSTISGNGVRGVFASGLITVRNSLIAGNSNSYSYSGTEIVVRRFSTITTENNLLGDSSKTTDDALGGFTAAASDITATADGNTPTALDAILAPLADNGGPTQTHALVAGSPAIDAGNNANIPADFADLDGDGDITEATPFDQRGLGFSRISNDQVDIGAFEVGDGPLVGNDSENTLVGSSGDDVIAGEAGDDQIFGLDGDDVLRGDRNRRSPQVGEAGGDDFIDGGAGNDRIGGKAGDDTLLGGAGDDQIWGDDGNDLLRGGLGNDRLIGDDFSGGQGSDTFILALGEGTDTLVDFEVGIDFIGLAEGLTFGALSLEAQANDTLIRIGAETLAIVQNVGVTDLTETSFTFV